MSNEKFVPHKNVSGPVRLKMERADNSGTTDALGRSQPLDGTIFWNPNGYEWTGVFKCEVTVR